MKKSLRFCALLVLAAALLTVSALADTGPKPQLTVKVNHPPEALYYLDLLAEGSWEHAGDSDYRGLGGKNRQCSQYSQRLCAAISVYAASYPAH